jgi:hypothetical protein
LRIREPCSSLDVDTVFELANLEELQVIDPHSAEDLRRLAEAPFERLPRLKMLLLRSAQDLGIDIAAGWLPTLTELERVELVRLGIPLENTDAVCHAGGNLRRLTFEDRDAEQTRRIVAAFPLGVVETWKPDTAAG